MNIFAHPETYFYQLGIFLLTLVALRFLVFGPYLKIYLQRRELTEAKEAQARALAEQAAALRAEVEQKIGVTSREGQVIREKFRLEGETEERRLLAEARAAGAEYYEKTLAALRQEAEQARRELQKLAPEHQRLVHEKLTEGLAGKQRGAKK